MKHDDRVSLLKRTELFVLDMDGTFYLGDEIIEGSLEFIEAVKRAGKRYLFFTNNSSTSAEKYIEKLSRMGLDISRDMIMTSGDVMISFLKNTYPDKSVYLLGTKPLEESFLMAGIKLFNIDNLDALANIKQRPDIVVAGFDKTLTFQKLSNACTYIREGAAFLATHLDINCPVQGGFIPDCGSICKAIELSTGVEPRFVGKPFKETVDMIVGKTNTAREKIAFVGDRIYTDVATGVNNGAMGLLVLTGETRREDIELSEVKPDAVFDSLFEIGTLLEGNNV